MLVINDNVGTLSEAHKKRLEVIGVSAISDGLDSLNLEGNYVLPAEIAPLVEQEKTLVGVATTVYAPQGTSLPLHLAVFTHAHNRILMVGTDKHRECSYIGDIQALIAKKNGCAGIIIDGYIRDAKSVVETEIPMYCTGRMPNKPNKEDVGGINVPIRIGNVTINNGDIVCADGDGIIVIPSSQVEAVIDAAESKEFSDVKRRNEASGFNYEYAHKAEDYLSIMTKAVQEYVQKNKD